mmetsp:Transcript_104025/g.310670  ORF Transcript_104025/g.310670 Transcript_104025/m.310670 type:complete len:260 (+) Transcript_104025:182-961(+)
MCRLDRLVIAVVHHGREPAKCLCGLQAPRGCVGVGGQDDRLPGVEVLEAQQRVHDVASWEHARHAREVIVLAGGGLLVVHPACFPGLWLPVLRHQGVVAWARWELPTAQAEVELRPGGCVVLGFRPNQGDPLAPGCGAEPLRADAAITELLHDPQCAASRGPRRNAWGGRRARVRVHVEVQVRVAVGEPCRLRDEGHGCPRHPKATAKGEVEVVPGAVGAEPSDMDPHGQLLQVGAICSPGEAEAGEFLSPALCKDGSE